MSPVTFKLNLICCDTSNICWWLRGEDVCSGGWDHGCHLILRLVPWMNHLFMMLTGSFLLKHRNPSNAVCHLYALVQCGWCSTYFPLLLSNMWKSCSGKFLLSCSDNQISWLFNSLSMTCLYGTCQWKLDRGHQINFLINSCQSICPIRSTIKSIPNPWAMHSAGLMQFQLII